MANRGGGRRLRGTLPLFQTGLSSSSGGETATASRLTTVCSQKSSRSKTLTGRCLDELRTQGYAAQVVESWIPRANVRRDLFGMIDVLAVKQTGPESAECLALQVTSWTNVSSRVKKIRENPVLPILLALGWRVEVWGYRKGVLRWERRVVSL